MITKEEQLALSNHRVFVLMKEYEIINAKIEQFLSRQPAMFGAGVIAILTIIGFLSKGSVEEIDLTNKFLLWAVLSLPFFTLFYMDIILYHMMRTLTIQGYKRALERKINNIVGDNYLNFSVVGMNVENKNKYRIAFALGFIALLSFSILIPVIVIIDNWEFIYEQHFWPVLIVSVFFILFFSASIYATIFVSTAFENAIKATQEEQNNFDFYSKKENSDRSKTDLEEDIIN